MASHCACYDTPRTEQEKALTMLHLTRWFDIPNLSTPFLAINLSNRKPTSRQTNAELFPMKQTGHWQLPKAALDHEVEGRPVVLFYSEKGVSTLYVGTCASKMQSGQTKNGQPRYTLTVTRHWENVGETDVTFSAFFDGFPLSSNATVLWADLSRYTPPKDEAAIDESGNDDGDFSQDGEGGYNETVTSSLRVNHNVFVARLNKIWKGRCALTDLQAPRLVQACHIIPWNEATPEERVSAHNGLLLCAHLHALFDSHLLGFDSQGHLLLADDLSETVRVLVLAGGKKQLRKPPTKEQMMLLKRHQDAARKAGHRLVRV